MLKVRASNDRGQIDHGWLYARHTFSFGHYFDEAHMGFRALRVINEDTVKGGQGFGTHPHRDMEIVTYVLKGALEHKDSMGNGSVLRPGKMQRMTAGTGVTHSEFNHSKSEDVHLLQIWMLPDAKGLEPGYEEKDYSKELDGALRLVASPDGRDGSLTVNCDVMLYAGRLYPEQELRLELAPERYAWVQVAKGALDVGGDSGSPPAVVSQGDGVSTSGERKLTFAAGRHGAEILVFDLA